MRTPLIDDFVALSRCTKNKVNISLQPRAWLRFCSAAWLRFCSALYYLSEMFVAVYRLYVIRPTWTRGVSGFKDLSVLLGLSIFLLRRNFRRGRVFRVIVPEVTRRTCRPEGISVRPPRVFLNISSVDVLVYLVCCFSIF